MTSVIQAVKEARASGVSRADVLMIAQDALDAYENEYEQQDVLQNVHDRIVGEGCPFLEVVPEYPDRLNVLVDVDDGQWWYLTLTKGPEREPDES